MCISIAVINDKDQSKDEDFLNNINDDFVLDLEKSLKNVHLGNSQEPSDTDTPVVAAPKPKIDFVQYESELQMPMIMKIIQKDLSEPYSIYTYRYFIHNWPKLCFLVSDFTRDNFYCQIPILGLLLKHTFCQPRLSNLSFASS